MGSPSPPLQFLGRKVCVNTSLTLTCPRVLTRAAAGGESGVGKGGAGTGWEGGLMKGWQLKPVLTHTGIGGCHLGYVWLLPCAVG